MRAIPADWIGVRGGATRRILLRQAPLAGVAGVGLLAACAVRQPGGAGEAPAGNPLAGAAAGPARLVWAYWGNQEQVEVREAVFAAFQQRYPAITIDKMHNPGSLDDHFAKVQVLVSSGSGLDLFMSSPIWAPNLADRALYQPLDRLMARDKFAAQDFSPAALSAFAFRAKQYALPEILNYAVVVYNEDVLRQAGEKPPAADWTWEQFVDMAQRLTARAGGEVTRWGTGPTNTDLNNTLPWIWSNGGRIFDDEQDPKRSTFNTAPATEAVQWRADWAHRLGVAPKPGQITQPGDPFVAGLLATSVTTLATFPTLARTITSFTWDVAQIPRGKAGRVNFTGASGQGIATNSKFVDQAWLALQYQASRDGLVPYMRAQWGVPPLLGLARRDYLQLAPPPANRRAVVDALDTLRPLPKMPAMLELYNQVYGAELGNVYAGRRTARDAAVEVDQQVQAKLAAR